GTEDVGGVSGGPGPVVALSQGEGRPGNDRTPGDWLQAGTCIAAGRPEPRRRPFRGRRLRPCAAGGDDLWRRHPDLPARGRRPASLPVPLTGRRSDRRLGERPLWVESGHWLRARERTLPTGRSFESYCTPQFRRHTRALFPLRLPLNFFTGFAQWTFWPGGNLDRGLPFWV